MNNYFIPTKDLTLGEVKEILNNREYRNILMHEYGAFVLAASRDVLRRTHMELMQPLGDLSDFIEADITIDWARYKKDQRAVDRRAQARALAEWNKRQKGRRIRWGEIGKQTTRSPTATTPTADTTFIHDMLRPFNDKANQERAFQSEYMDTTKRGESYIYPYRQHIIQQIMEGKKSIHELTPIIQNRKKDKAIQFQFITEMAHHNQITINQTKHLGDIQITPSQDEASTTNVLIRDRGGNTHPFDWTTLNLRQRKKIIEDLKEGNIVQA